MLELRDSDLFRQACMTASGWREVGSGEAIVVVNPATQEVIGSVPAFSEDEVTMAIDQADVAFRDWSREPATARAAVLRRWHALMLSNCDDLARIITSEQGKPLAEARSEVLYAASFLEWFAEEAKRVYGEMIPAPNASDRVVTLRQPIGVTTAITPWNFPAAMIVRPSELTPFTALAIGVLAERAGLPPGVLQIITGDGPLIGKVLTASETVRKLSFTGSTAVGRKLMA